MLVVLSAPHPPLRRRREWADEQARNIWNAFDCAVAALDLSTIDGPYLGQWSERQLDAERCRTFWPAWHRGRVYANRAV